jgi:hypothetical protein
VTELERAKLRPWAAVWRVRTTDGVLYAKQNCPGQGFEAALLAEMVELAPAYLVPLAAVDRGRGLLLTPDQGAVFAETVPPDDLDAWCRLVRRAMELARLLVPHVDRLAEVGLSTCRVPTGREGAVAVLLDEVGPLGLGDTVVHNDLHEHNAFDREEGLVFFDFADAVLAHPLSGLLVPLSVLAHHLGEPGPDDPRLRRVAEAALEVWSDLAPMTDLRRALPAALCLGRLGRAESWARIGPDLTGDAAREFGNAHLQWWDRLEDPAPVRFS